MHDRTTFDPTPYLAPLCAAHGLGMARSVAQPPRGSINACRIVNEAYVFRFDTLAGKGAGRFHNEAAAYRALARTGLPIPSLTALDETRAIAPCAVIITTKLPGEPVIDAWPSLPPARREQIAHAAGDALAQMHTVTFCRFGALGKPEAARFDRWYDYVADYLDRYARQAISRGVIGADEHARMAQAVARHRPLLDTVTRGALLHSDCHWENILTDGVTVTGIIDFEWALAGDPAWDFVVAPKWEVMCPGSARHTRAGYAHRRLLPDDHATRVMIYALLAHVETAVDEANRGNAAGVAAARDALFDTLTFLVRA